MTDSEPPVEETRLASFALSPSFRSAPRLTWQDARGRHRRVVDRRLLVGSSPDSGIVLTDETVSRIHAELDPRTDGLWLRDLGSRNGSFVEGLRVTGACVPEAGRIRLGSTELVVDYDTSEKTPVEVWPNDSFGKLVGTSVVMRELFATLSRVAPMDASVLVQGETGTGKELVARAIHDASPRAMKPFVVVDCAALPENLLDAELFGHARGAFTGAIAARAGAIESADGGTVFLDEIGELPLAMQPKLLRVLEAKGVRRVGESTYRAVDVRFISATHRDLLTMVNSGEFREDLYFRLSVIPVSVPPLRDRKQDVERLVNHFLQLSGDGLVSVDLMRQIIDRPWRGNVRELRNFVERARALGTEEALAMVQRAQELGGGPLPSDRSRELTPLPRVHEVETPPGPAAETPRAVFEAPYKDFREAWIDSGEKEYVRRLLERHQRNVTAAAREANVDRTYIYRLIRKHDL